MLDQNTDRMWFVIGAVIVGAAIIFIANGTLPTLFASVSDSFNASADEATDVVDDIRPAYVNRQYLTLDDVTTHGSVSEVVQRSRQWEYVSGLGRPGWMVSGFRVRRDVIEVPYGASGVLNVEIWIPETYADTYASIDINMYPVSGSSWGSNDNDHLAKRTINGEPANFRWIPIEAGAWNTLMVHFENTDPRNTEQVAIYKGTSFGLMRDQLSVDRYPEIPVRLRNVYVELIE